MTCLGVVKNTKTDFIVFHTISFRVVLFVQASPIGSLAKKTATAVGMVNSMKIKSVSHYQKQYDTMVKIAKSSMDNGVSLTPQFQRELLSLTKLLKSIGGKV
jgi:hypothetical protein